MTDLSNKTDEQLISSIRTRKNSESLKEIAERYKKVYFSVCGKYKTNEYFTNFDVDNEIYHVFYTACKKFDKERGMKFSTYLYSHVNYACMKFCTSHKRKIKNLSKLSEEPIIADAPKDDKERVATAYRSIISLKNTKAKKILLYRYFDKSGKLKTFQEIGKKVKLTFKAVQMIHDRYINHLKYIQNKHE